MARNIVVSQDFFPKVGGAHSWLYEIYRRWPTNVQLTTVCYNSDSEETRRQSEFEDQDHGRLEIIRKNPHIEEIDLFDFRFITQVFKIVKNIRNLTGWSNTTLHCLRAFPEGFVGLAAKMTKPIGSKLITYAHGEEIFISQTSRQLRSIARWVYAGSNLIIANSKNTVKLVRQVYPKAMVKCINPGVDVQSFIRQKAELIAKRLEWQWPLDTIVICTIGRMEPRKNHSMVIRAVGELRKQGLSIGYVCGTAGEEKEKLIRMVNELNLQKWVYFTGIISDEEKILTYGACDIFIMPSIQSGPLIEGFGMVFLEAAAAGKPAICGNSGGQTEAVLDGVTGMVVDGSSIEQVKNAIRALVMDKALRDKMGREGLRWAKENDWSKVFERTYRAISAIY